ncbi:shugoshin-like protein [Beauveria bassiana ARSEF 2860]|uniref:Shugoshin-like protein n=1 Tax=Beauveria bassiana (strain ARSEF 2860) TaxID=655819 RepID=J5JJU2_BEAB2|nr:shugoshin-like protein [Beauveria bassiana ARSEF 2860]EJP63561.1 shugoshin-like protein [Beauveria bassiana ARSEF 2860]
MARLNEPALSTDSTIENLRKKMLRQNRELAKTNNVRALRIRELESELSNALTENLKLRGYIVELEQERHENDARQDHALTIKKELEAQLAEWSTLVAGLGQEPPIKRQWPRAADVATGRMNFTATRPSPSQRRLRDVANDIEQLGHIAEHKAYSRMSMNSDQIRASRPDADYDELLPELPAPASIGQQSTKADTTPRESRIRNFSGELDSSPLVVSSPNLDNLCIGSVPPTKSMTPMIRDTRVHVDSTPDTPIAPPLKTGTKRKFNRDDYEPMTLEHITDENKPPRTTINKASLLENARGKTLRELAAGRREAARAEAARNAARVPLAKKSTNDDVQSPKKRRTTSVDESSSLKKTGKKTESASVSAEKLRAFLAAAAERRLAQQAALPVVATIEPSRLDTGYRKNKGDTPPPTDIGSQGETSRPSRRSRPAISYAEPNLRDKMRRPRNETFDAVSGEGKSRRFSHSEISTGDVKRESTGSDSFRKYITRPRSSDVSTESAPARVAAGHSSLPHELPSTVQANRRQRSSRQASPASEQSDVYEFSSSSPHTEESSGYLTRRSGRRTTAPRRLSAADNEDHGVVSHITTRRRSMMV